MIKVFIQNDRWGKFLKRDIEEIAKKEGVKVKIVTPLEEGNSIIPRGFEVYLLHMSEVSGFDVIELRKKQKQSLIYALIGGIDGYISDSLKEANDQNHVFDKFYSTHTLWPIIEKEAFNEIFNDIKNYGVKKR